jgi:hypothetical protein
MLNTNETVFDGSAVLNTTEWSNSNNDPIAFVEALIGRGHKGPIETGPQS